MRIRQKRQMKKQKIRITTDDKEIKETGSEDKTDVDTKDEKAKAVESKSGKKTTAVIGTLVGTLGVGLTAYWLIVIKKKDREDETNDK